MSTQLLQIVAGVRIGQPDSRIALLSTIGKGFAIGSERYPLGAMTISPKLAKFLAGVHVP